MAHKLNLRIYRYKPGHEPHYDTFAVEVPETANVLDAIERAWDDHDRTLIFRHACHHASCGSCGLRIDGVDLAKMVRDHGPLPAEQACDFIRQAALGLQIDREFAARHGRVVPVVATGQKPGDDFLGYPEEAPPDLCEMLEFLILATIVLGVALASMGVAPGAWATQWLNALCETLYFAFCRQRNE